MRAHFYGDSIMHSLAPALAASTPAGWTFIDRAIPGTAACDMIPRLATDLTLATPPDVVVFEDIGNSGSPCMIDPASGSYLRVGSAAWLARYRTDFATLLRMAAGKRVVYVLPPPMQKVGTEAAVSKLAISLTSLALAAKATVTSAPRLAVAPTNVWSATLPSGGPVIRKPDGIHLTPEGADLFAAALLPSVCG